MHKKTGRSGLFAAAVLLIGLFLAQPVSDTCSTMISHFTELSMKLTNKSGLGSEQQTPDTGRLVTAPNDEGQTVKEEALNTEEEIPADPGVFRRVLDKINQLVKHIRKLVLGEG